MTADEYLALYRRADAQAGHHRRLAQHHHEQATQLELRADILFALHYRTLKGLPI